MGCDPGGLALFFIFMENEEWRPVKDYEEAYEVSNMGRVRSLKRKVRNRHPTGQVVKGRFVKLCVSNGYHVMNLWKSNKHRTVRVHRLVAEAFIENPFNYPEVNHINLVRSDNRVENLEWCTHRGNMKHAYDHGKIPIGDRHKCAKLTNENVLEIRDAFSKENNIGLRRARDGFVRELSERFNVSRSAISQVINNVRWRHILNQNEGDLRKNS